MNKKLIMNKYFYEVFENIPRQGPGTVDATLKALNSIKSRLPGQTAILDIGCGKGVQSIILAQNTEGSITVLDNHQFFLDCVRDKAEKGGFGDRFKYVNADMSNLAFNTEEFDILWAEGSIFVIGIKAGLKQWKKHIRQNGFLVLSDLLWLSDNRPAELTEYFENECMYVLTVDEALEEARKNGYSVIDHFTLPLEGWTTEFIDHETRVIADLRNKYKNIPEAISTFDAIQYESAIVKKYLGYFGYEFLILCNS
ncbi:MAG: class I SAM-dependent methyltransferase [Bacteroidales bacterium]|nr:class I SAM-dependent methyltransferase [Bacteroidales bacterium]